MSSALIKEPQGGWRSFFERQHAFFKKPLNVWSRLALVLASIALILAMFFPIWQIHLLAPQYPKGLDMWIYVWKLDAGNGGQDLFEINLLNHYIGMRALEEADFLEMQWMPFAFGIFFILLLRAAVIGKMIPVIDIGVMMSYFGIFSLGSFYYRLYTYGHNLDPRAAVKIEPFTPTMLGVNKIANFTQSAFPHVGGFLLGACWVLVVASVFLSCREKPI